MSAYNFNTVPHTTCAASFAEPLLSTQSMNHIEFTNDFSREADPARQRGSSQRLVRNNTLPTYPAPTWSVHAEPSYVQSSATPLWSHSFLSTLSRPSAQITTASLSVPQQAASNQRSPSELRATPWPTPSTTARQSTQWATPTPATIPLKPPTRMSPTSPESQRRRRSDQPTSGPPKISLSTERWPLRGSCACAFVQYELSASPTELPLQACYCHCATCRNLSGSNYVAFTSVPSERLRWYSGAFDWKTGRGAEITEGLQQARSKYEYGKAPGFSAVNARRADSRDRANIPDPGAAPWERHVDQQTHAGATLTMEGIETENEPAIRLWSSSRKAVRGSCARCGSTLFISYHSNVLTTDVAIGTLWGSEEKGQVLVKPVMHIMLREKALWDTVPEDGLQRFEGMPGESESWRDGDNGQGKGKKQKRTPETRLQTLRHLVKCSMIY